MKCNRLYGGGLACLLTAGFVLASAVRAEDRYQLWRRDGTRLSGQRFERPFDPKHPPRLDDKDLIRPQLYLRAIHDTSQRSRLDGPYVELVNGDVLPGVVCGSVPGDSQTNQVPLIVMLVSGDARRRPERKRRGDRGQRDAFTIPWPSVRRLVLQPSSSGPVEPGVIRLRDGRRLAPQAIRLSETGIIALTDDGVSRIGFSELGEVHLPARGTIEAVLADGVWWQGDPANPVVRLSTTNGARITFAFSMARTLGSNIVVRPRWASRALHLDKNSIVWVTFRSGDEVPLSLLPAEILKTRALLHHWPWRRNRNVHGADLHCGSMTAELGVGTHSYSQVAFDLPGKAKTFTTWVGLDVAAGRGGCVDCSVYRDAVRGRPLWQGRFMRGSSTPVRIGGLNIAGAKRLVLVTDFAHQGRPAGADPLDIRDFVDWLMPLVKVDRASLPRPSDILAQWMPALGGWSIPPGQLKTLKVTTDMFDGRTWEAAVDVDPVKGLTLSRKITPSLKANVLDVTAVRGRQDGAHVISLLVDGKEQEGFSVKRGMRRGNVVPALYTHDTNPRGDSWIGMRWHLGDHNGKEVTLTLRATRDAKRQQNSKALIFRDISLCPLVHGLPANGRILVPDVPLSQAAPIKIVDYKNRKNPREVPAPKPATRTVHGVTLPNSYVVTRGTNMTYKLDPTYRRFVAVVASANPYHRGPFQVYLDGKLIWQSGRHIDAKLLQQAIVDIPAGSSTISLNVVHDMTSGVWGQAGFMKE